MVRFDIAVRVLAIDVRQVNVLVVDAFDVVTKVASGHAEVRVFE
jgi:hypothetical protein